jgi:pyruvate dehydrogenase E1 component
VIEGGYWLRDYRGTPDYGQARRFNLVSTGVMTPQALAASDQLREEGIYANVIQVTSADRLYQGWWRHLRAGADGEALPPPYLDELFPPGERHPLVSVLDGHPLTLQWLGTALGVPQVALGVTMFGESGDIESLYRAMGIHADNIVAGVARLIVDGVRGRGPGAAAGSAPTARSGR